MYCLYIKPLIDRSFGLLGLLLFFPVLLVVGICLIVENKGNPFFFQSRPGKHRKCFRIIKFKTMNDQKDSEGKLLPDAERMTPTGRFIRKTSLDELPQLLNVVKGELSFIGPRPLLVEYLPLYNHQQSRRHEVLPGITGWAQVNGRNSISWERKFELDVEYIENQSFVLDLKILLLTVKKVFVREGINAEEGVTMKKFEGTVHDLYR